MKADQTTVATTGKGGGEGVGWIVDGGLRPWASTWHILCRIKSSQAPWDMGIVCQWAAGIVCPWVAGTVYLGASAIACLWAVGTVYLGA